MDQELHPLYSKRRIRIAVLLMFLAQGLCFSSWASRLPDIKADFGVANFLHFGILMFIIPIGKFIAIPAVGFLLPRIGSKKTVLISLGGYVLSLFVLGVITGIHALAVDLLFFGIFWNMTDISLNTQAIEVERIYGKPIIATFHATWSLAACLGALLGFLMINWAIIPSYHFTLVSSIAVLLILFNYKFLLEAAPQSAKAKPEKKPEVKKRLAVPEVLLILLGVIWLLALIVENTMFEWSDLYFQSVIKAPKSLQVGFLIFMVMMFSGRVLTNWAYSKWSKRTILQAAGLCIFAGFVTSSLFIGFSDEVLSKVIINSVGFMLIGLGISCMVPTIYSIVGDKSTTPIGTALTIMSSISFVGPLVAPLLVGTISHHYGMRYAYLIISLFGAGIVAIATLSKSLKN